MMPSDTAIFTIQSKGGEVCQLDILSRVFFVGLCLIAENMYLSLFMRKSVLGFATG